MRKAIRGHLENNPALEKLLPHIKGNVGFVFTKEDLAEIRDLLLANKVPAAARAGAIAPCEVIVPAQNTGLGPEKTSFFQALGITTKISRGTIEIFSDVGLIKTGDKVGASEATQSFLTKSRFLERNMSFTSSVTMVGMATEGFKGKVVFSQKKVVKVVKSRSRY